jgi:hypothetical protein
MAIQVKLTEAVLLALLTFAGTFGAGYGYGHQRGQASPKQVVCLTPQDVAQVYPKRPTS